MVNEALEQYQKALEIDDKAAAPKMNLAELAVKDGDLQHAIELYKRAIEDDPERGLAYLRLGQLIIQNRGSRQEVIAIWKKGLVSTPDEEIKKKLQKALSEQ